MEFFDFRDARVPVPAPYYNEFNAGGGLIFLDGVNREEVLDFDFLRSYHHNDLFYGILLES